MDVSKMAGAVRSGLEIALPEIAAVGRAIETISGGNVSFEATAQEMQSMQEKHLQDQMRMQMLMEEYTHKSNISKSLHDAAMAVLNNIRVR